MHDNYHTGNSIADNGLFETLLIIIMSKNENNP